MVKASQVNAEYEAERQSPEERGFYTPANVDGVNITIREIDTYGEFPPRPPKKEGDPYMHVLFTFGDGSDDPEIRKLSISGRLFPILQKFFDAHPGEWLECRIYKDFPFPGANTQGWMLGDWDDSAIPFQAAKR